MSQHHAYNADLSYHFANLALAAEVQTLWEVGDAKNPDIENVFAIPRPYYDQLFFASDTSSDAMYEDIQGYIMEHYEVIGTIRVGRDVIPDYMEMDSNWTFSNIENFQQVFDMMHDYTQRVGEAISNRVRYSFSRLLMGYGLRSKVDGHGVIVMRGTFNVQEWLNNMNYRLVPYYPLETAYGYVHNGFRDIYKGVRGGYRQLVEKIESDKDLYLVGHSLGASVSQLAALDISLKNPERADRIHVYGYAPPRTGDKAFADAYNYLVRTSYRIINVCDVIPYLPFDKLGIFMGTQAYAYADTKGELSYIHQTGNPIANHINSYHVATRYQTPTVMDTSQPRRLV
jgi:hypothetical protein